MEEWYLGMDKKCAIVCGSYDNSMITIRLLSFERIMEILNGSGDNIKGEVRFF